MLGHRVDPSVALGFSREPRYYKRIPHLLLVGNVRFSLDAVLQWGLANSIPGGSKGVTEASATPAPDAEPKARRMCQGGMSW